jgi:hypothetical protein
MTSLMNHSQPMNPFVLIIAERYQNLKVSKIIVRLHKMEFWHNTFQFKYYSLSIPFDHLVFKSQLLHKYKNNR